ncbi:MAG: hypothetical protein PF961_13460 [Planctomycetota bacterium]|jgi:hypothetical protein|nr:hypothetical protein [Planctomycetota bacterium]
MRSSTDSRSQIAALLPALLPAAVVIACAAAWVLLRPAVAPASVDAVLTDVAPEARTGPGVDARSWRVRLYQPLHEVAPVAEPVAPPPPITASLIAIAERGGKPVAVLETEKNGRLQYLAEGEKSGRYTVTSVEAGAVELQVGGRTVRLELPQ